MSARLSSIPKCRRVSFEKQTASPVCRAATACKMRTRMLSSEAEHSQAEPAALSSPSGHMVGVLVWSLQGGDETIWFRNEPPLRALRAHQIPPRRRPPPRSPPVPSLSPERDGNPDVPGRPAQSFTRSLLLPPCLGLLRASRCSLIYCDSANCCN